MNFKVFKRYNLSVIYLSIFVVFLAAVFVKFLLNIHNVSLPCSLADIFSRAFLYKLLVILPIFYLIYTAGSGFRGIFCFKYNSTGIFGFLAFTFLANLILSIFGVSSAINEVTVLFCALPALVILRIVQLKGARGKIIAGIMLVLSVLILSYLPAQAFWDKPVFLTDEAVLWRPMASSYFDGGLADSMLARPSQGYGLFIPHVFVTIKRLALFNQGSIASYAFMPNVLFFIGLLFLAELRIKPIAKFLLIALFVLYIFVQRWIALLLCDSLMSDGLAGLLFAIILKELLDHPPSGQQQGALEKIRFFAGFWVAAGVLGLSKPFVSVLCYLFPAIALKGVWSAAARPKIITKVILAAALMSVCFLLWAAVSAELHVGRLLAYKPGVINSFNPIVALDMFRFWVTDRYFVPMALLVFSGLILGINRFNRWELSSCFMFIALNVILIIGIYAFYGRGWEIESSYRFLVQMTYVSFFALGLALDSIIRNLKHAAGPGVRIKDV